MGDLGNQAEEGAQGGVEERGKESPEDHPGALFHPLAEGQLQCRPPDATSSGYSVP